MEKINLDFNIDNPERTKKSEEIQGMGGKASESFIGGGNKAIEELYGDSELYYADIIKEELTKRDKPYTFLDIGSYDGGFLKKVINALPEYNIETVATDINQKELVKNFAGKKVVASAEKLPLADESVDVATMRYVLHLNDKEKQEEILKEIHRVIKRYAIIEHAGADNEETDEWKKVIHGFYESKDIPEFKRTEFYFSSRNEIEALMDKNKIPFDRVMEKKVNNLSDTFITRFNMSEDSAKKTKERLAGKDHITRTIWLINKERKNKP